MIAPTSFKPYDTEVLSIGMKTYVFSFILEWEITMCQNSRRVLFQYQNIVTIVYTKLSSLFCCNLVIF